LGALQMTLSDYHLITASEFFNKMDGYYKQLHEMQQAEWLRTNYLVYAIMSMHPYIKAKDKPKSFDDFMKQQEKANEKAKKLIEQL
jgi:hypothetical protein